MKKRYLLILAFVILSLVTSYIRRNDGPEVTVKVEPSTAGMETVISTMKNKMSDSALNHYVDEYPGELGTLCVYGLNDAPDSKIMFMTGKSTFLAYVSKDGTTAEFVFPECNYGACHYVDPRDISFKESGRVLTFATQIMEQGEDEAKLWHNVVCTFDTVELKMIRVEATA